MAEEMSRNNPGLSTWRNIIKLRGHVDYSWGIEILALGAHCRPNS